MSERAVRRGTKGGVFKNPPERIKLGRKGVATLGD